MLCFLLELCALTDRAEVACLWRWLCCQMPLIFINMWANRDRAGRGDKARREVILNYCKTNVVGVHTTRAGRQIDKIRHWRQRWATLMLTTSLGCHRGVRLLGRIHVRNKTQHNKRAQSNGRAKKLETNHITQSESTIRRGDEASIHEKCEREKRPHNKTVEP